MTLVTAMNFPFIGDSVACPKPPVGLGQASDSVDTLESLEVSSELSPLTNLILLLRWISCQKYL